MPDAPSLPTVSRSQYPYNSTTNDVRKQAHHLYASGRQPNPAGIPTIVTASVQNDAESDTGLGSHVELGGHGKPKSHQSARASTAKSINSRSLTFYPAYTHTSSPTYFKWVNLTAYGIHNVLTAQRGYSHSWQSIGNRYQRDVPQLLFYLNHPVQFVQVVGVVVSLDEWFERFWMFTVDDSSGATIDVVCPKPEKKRNETKFAQIQDDENDQELELETIRLSAQVAELVQIGAILQVKGTVTLFKRNKTVDTVLSKATHVGGVHTLAVISEEPIRQITLARLTVVHDTNEELALIAARTKFHAEVLSKPWAVSHRDQAKLHKKALGEVQHKQKRVEKHAATKRQAEVDEEADARLIMETYEDDERLRSEEAAKTREAGKRLRTDLGASKHTQSSRKGNTVCIDDGVIVDNSTSVQVTRRQKRKKHRHSEDLNLLSRTPTVDAGNSTTMSFSADDDEKSALLRAAFG